MDTIDLNKALHKGDCKELLRLLNGHVDFVSGNEAYLLSIAVNISPKVPISHILQNLDYLLKVKRLRNGINQSNVTFVLVSAIKGGYVAVIERLLKEPCIVEAIPGSDVALITRAMEEAKEEVISLLRHSSISKHIFKELDGKRKAEPDPVDTVACSPPKNTKVELEPMDVVLNIHSDNDSNEEVEKIAHSSEAQNMHGFFCRGPVGHSQGTMPEVVMTEAEFTQ